MINSLDDKSFEKNFKFNLSDSVITGFDCFKLLLDQKRIDTTILYSRQNGNQLVMRDSNCDFFFSCASRRDNMYKGYIENNNVQYYQSIS